MSTTPEPQTERMVIKDTDQFKNAVRAYVDLYDNLLASSRHMKDLRKRKEVLCGAIVEFMRENSIDELKLNDGKLIRREAKHTESLKPDHIVEHLKKIIGDETAAQAAMDAMMRSRQVEVKDSLRRTRARETEKSA